jgi:hypothetical protein
MPLGAAGSDGTFGEVFEQTRVIIDQEQTLFGKSHLPLRTIARELLDGYRSILSFRF